MHEKQLRCIWSRRNSYRQSKNEMLQQVIAEAYQPKKKKKTVENSQHVSIVISIYFDINRIDTGFYSSIGTLVNRIKIRTIDSSKPTDAISSGSRRFRLLLLEGLETKKKEPLFKLNIFFPSFVFILLWKCQWMNCYFVALVFISSGSVNELSSIQAALFCSDQSYESQFKSSIQDACLNVDFMISLDCFGYFCHY